MDDNESISISEETNTHSEQKENEITIDLNDLTLIEDPSTWDPPKEYIIAYAKNLEFDIENGSQEILDIAKKYLLKPLPENYIRAFFKDTLKIIYIYTITNESYYNMEFENEAREEYENLKKKLNEKKNDKKEEKQEEKENEIDKISNEQEKRNSLEKRDDEDDEENENEEVLIDENDLTIITNTSSWEPTKEQILAFAKHLGIDIDNDPPECLEIAKKYLQKPLKDDYWRAFSKNNNQIFYINYITYEINESDEIEKEAIEEYKNMKKNINKEKEDNIKNDDTSKKSDVEVEDEEIKYLDPEDLIIIRDPLLWEPTQEQILSFAKKLNFEVDNNNPEILDIAKKYLLKSLPNGFLRGFLKENLEILYINENNDEITLSYPYEEEAKKEYEILKQKILENKDDNDGEDTPEDIIIDRKLLYDNYKYKLYIYKKKVQKKFLDEKKNFESKYIEKNIDSIGLEKNLVELILNIWKKPNL